MGLLDCLHIALPAIFSVLLITFGPVAFGVYKYSLKAVAIYALGLPQKVLGYALIAFRQKVTIILATLTAFRGTIAELASTLSTGTGWWEVGMVFLEDLISKTFAATSLLAQGFDKWLEFLNTEGICSQLVNLDLLVAGALDIWTGFASIIILMFLYRLYRGRWQKAEVDKHETYLFIAFIFVATALLQIGIEQTQLYTVFERGMSLADAVSGLIPTPEVGGEAVNQSLNQSVNSTS